MSQKSIKKNFAFSIIQKLFSLLMPVITFPYASRILLPEGIGKVNFAHSIISYFSMIASLGIWTYAVREGSKVRENNDDFSKFSKEILTINLIATIISYCLLFLTLFFVNKLHPYSILILICSSSMLFNAIGVDWIYNAKEEFKYISIRSVIFQLLSLIYLFIFVRDQNDIIHYTIFGILSGTGSNILNFIHSKTFINWKTKYSIEIKKHLKPIFTLFGMSAAQTVYLVLDISILGFLAGDQAVGYYTAASKINKMVIGLLTVQNGIFLPRLSYYAEHDLEKYNNLLKKSFELCLLFMIPSFFGFCILSKDILVLFCGINYLPSINSMYILNCLIIFITISCFFSSSVLAPFRKDKYNLYSSIIGAISNLIFNFVFIPRFSHVGAAIATIIAEFLVSITIIIFTLKTIGIIKNLFLNFYQYILAGTIMAICVFLLHHFIESSILGIVFSILLGIIVYTCILLLLKNDLLLSVLKNILKKLKQAKQH